MFEEVCSIYASATDNCGRYVDMETGECIQQMSIREFCLTDRWKPYVQRLRSMRQQYGSAAKKMPEYIDTKKRLPGATLSGLFGLWEDESLTEPGRRLMVSRRETHLQHHTGWLAIDIDLADNAHLSNFDNVRMACRFRPEIALLMRSCSGTGYFGLVKLAYPDRHKGQFKALIKEYASVGINIDKACGNIGRVRFASWDEPENIYINENATAYCGVADMVVMPSPKPRFTDQSRQAATNSDHQPGQIGYWQNDTPDIVLRKARVLVRKIEAKGVNILGNYDDWIRCGMSLYRVCPDEGYDLWKRVSRFRPPDANHGHHESDFVRPWQTFGRYNYSPNTFFMFCKQAGVTLSREEMIEIYN